LIAILSDVLKSRKIESEKTGPGGRAELDANRPNSKMAAASYIFQIELAEAEGSPSAALAAGKLPAVIVEVLPEGLRHAESSGGERDKRERAAAESVARVAAAEALGDAIPQGSDPAYLIAQLGQLPELLQEREPNLRKSGLSAWLLARPGSGS
jgi:hypothetical protein